MKKSKSENGGVLRIGDEWRAITILASSQNNPLKAVAEFVENSIDARARKITIVRGKEAGVPYLKVSDDGDGIRRNEHGEPDFRFVATHICDSIKKQLKAEGTQGIQGEFGIGLLSFWIVGEELCITSPGADGKTYQMRMRKGDPRYTVTQRRTLVSHSGTELTIRNILSGIRQLSGEKIQWYLASELRDRIRTSGVQIKVIDHAGRTQFMVEPRRFEGRLLHDLPKPAGDGPTEVWVEVYLDECRPTNQVGLHRSGTRVLDDLTQLDAFQRPPWTSRCLQGIVDAAYLNLTPGTRAGIIQDAALERLLSELKPVEEALIQKIDAQQRAEEEQASRDVLRSVQKALKEALLSLPAEEYDWFHIHADSGGPLRKPASEDEPAGASEFEENGNGIYKAEGETDGPQKQLFEYPGPLFSVRISPTSCVMPVGGSKSLRALPRDRSRRHVEENLQFVWSVSSGEGSFADETAEIATFNAPKEPGLVKIKLIARQADVECEAEGLITVTDSLIPPGPALGSAKQGMPSYTFQKAPGELWRSKYNAEQNLIVINNGHRDFVFASKNKALKLRYVCRLFAKELVHKNFPGAPAEELLERLIELSLYTEEHLK